MCNLYYIEMIYYAFVSGFVFFLPLGKIYCNYNRSQQEIETICFYFICYLCEHSNSKNKTGLQS
jgi:hypothetical protein